MKLIVDAMAIGERQTPLVWQWLSLFIALIAAEAALWRVAGWLGCRTVVATGVDVRLDLFDYLARHPMGYFSGHLAGSLGSRITATAGAAGAIFGALTWRIVPPCVDFAGAVFIATRIDQRMAVTLVVFVVVVAGLITFFGGRGRPLHQAYARQGAAVGGEIVDVVANIWSVKAFAARDREYQKLQGSFGDEARAQQRSWLYLEKTRALHDLCLLAMAGSMLVWSLLSWSAGNSTAGDVVVISALTFRILHGSRDLALALVECSQQAGVVAETLAVIAQPHGVVDDAAAPDYKPGNGTVEFENVDFSYPGGRPVLKNFSLLISPGQRIGIVGASGAGKSSLVALIQRMVDPDNGRVLIDGQPIARVRQESLRRALAVVPQEIAMFHRSIIENIRYGRPEASDEEVYAAARDAGCDDFIRLLPQGYDTVVGERGTRLSGGQRQRIGIARALLMKAHILILDEATSALDSHSETNIQLALDSVMRGRTVVAIAHRLASVLAFDRVIVLNDGAIEEEGPPAQLLDRNGAFASMWALQSTGFETT